MSKQVLIVEDNELNMKLFQDLLEAHDIETLKTSDGHDVLALARKHKPDLILMDIQLPEISGLEVTKQLKSDDELKDIPVIAVTAFAMKGDEQKSVKVAVKIIFQSQYRLEISLKSYKAIYKNRGSNVRTCVGG